MSKRKRTLFGCAEHEAEFRAESISKIMEAIARDAHRARCEEEGHAWSPIGGEGAEPIKMICRWCGEAYRESDDG